MRKNLAKATSLLLAAGMMAGMCVTGAAAEESTGVSYPIVEPGTLEFDAFTIGLPTTEDIQTNDFTLYLEELTGIKVNYTTGSRQDYSEKLNLSLNSGDYADIIFGASVDLAKYGVKEQIIIPLDDYINEENCPNYLKKMEEYGLDMTREADGHIYSLAEINVCYHCQYGRKMWINQHYLDEMGCAMPTTTQEFYDVCAKFLEYKPDGVAIAGNTDGWYSRMQDWLIDAFVLMPDTSSTTRQLDTIARNKETGEVVCVGIDDRYKEAMKYLHSLYGLGAIYDGDFTQNSDQMKTLVNQTDAPVLCFPEGASVNVIDSSANPELYAQYVAMAPLEGPDGTRIAYQTANPGVDGGGFMITDACEDVAAALKWMDFFYSETGDLCSQFGADEGVDWVLYPEGKVGLNGEPAMYEILNPYSSDTQNHDWQDMGVRVAPADYRLGAATDPDVDIHATEGLEKMLYEASAELYAPYAGTGDIELFDTLKLTDAEATDIAVIAVEIEKVIDETSVAFITGAKDIDAEWDGYVQSVKNAGLDDLIAVYEIAYARSTGEAVAE